MAIDFGGSKMDYVSLPKVGEKGTKVFNVVRFEERRQDGHKLNFKNKEGKDFGFYYMAHLEDGSVFTITVFKLFYAIRDAYAPAGIESGADGIILEIGHPARGEWTANILGKLDVTTPCSNEEEDEEVVETVVATKAKVKEAVVAEVTPVAEVKTAKTKVESSLKDDLDELLNG